jgi:hypothetical protein
MKQKTTAENYYEALGKIAGTLFYLKRKDGSKTDYVFEALNIDTKKKDLTIRILKRAMNDPNFIAFPGTPEFYDFVNEEVDSSKDS